MSYCACNSNEVKFPKRNKAGCDACNTMLRLLAYCLLACLLGSVYLAALTLSPVAFRPLHAQCEFLHCHVSRSYNSTHAFALVSGADTNGRGQLLAQGDWQQVPHQEAKQQGYASQFLLLSLLAMLLLRHVLPLPACAGFMFVDDRQNGIAEAKCTLGENSSLFRPSLDFVANCLFLAAQHGSFLAK